MLQCHSPYDFHVLHYNVISVTLHYIVISIAISISHITMYFLFHYIMFELTSITLHSNILSMNTFHFVIM